MSTQVYTIRSCHGEFQCDVAGFVTGRELKGSANRALLQLKRFDVAEYQWHYGKMEDTDILLIGYWLDDGTYEPPEHSHRQMLLRDAQWHRIEQSLGTVLRGSLGVRGHDVFTVEADVRRDEHLNLPATHLTGVLERIELFPEASLILRHGEEAAGCPSLVRIPMSLVAELTVIDIDRKGTGSVDEPG